MFSFLALVLAIVVFVRLSNLSERVKQLEKEKGGMPRAVSKEPEKPIFVEREIMQTSGTRAVKIEDRVAIEKVPERQADEVAVTFFKKEDAPKVQDDNSRDLEFKLGGKIFTGIGAVAIMLGMGFFLRYAFENDLINETMRVVLGILAGAVMLGIGEFTRKKFSTYSQILTGAGLGILYLSLYSAFGYYHIISQPLAFVGMIVVTALGVTLSVRYDSQILAIFSQLGGFITPVILSTGENHPHTLFLYLALLNLGIFSIAWRKLWRVVVFFGFAGTCLAYLGWFLTLYTPSQLMVAEGYATLFFAIFTGVLLIHHFIRKSSQTSGDLILLLLNSGLYFLISYAIINPEHHAVMGIFAALLAALHLAIAYMVGDENENSSRFKQFLISAGIVLVTIAVPIQFEKHWITIGWATEALVLTGLGFRIRSKMQRLFGDVIYLLTFLRLIFIDAVLPAGATPWLNDRVFSFVFCIILFSLAATLYIKKKEELETDEVPILSLLAILAAVAFLVGGSSEIMQFFSHHWLSAFWSIGFAIIFAFAFLIRSLPLRLLAFLAAFIVLTRLLFIDGLIFDGAQAYLNMRVLLFLVAILSALAVILLYETFRDKVSQGEVKISIAIMPIYAYLLTIWLFTAEIFDFHPHYWLPIIWSLIALLAGWISFQTKNAALRFAAYLTFAVTFFRLLGYETNVNLSTYLPFFNSRVAAFLVVAAAMGIFLALFKKADVSESEKQLTVPVLFLGANIILIWLVSVEFVDYFKQQFLRLPQDLKSAQRIRYDNLQNVSLSISWTIYAIILLALGLLRKSTISRLASVFILSVVIFKVFLFDTSSLSTLYKFISFLTLGVILLLTGFLYNRYRERIMEFIKV